MCFFSCVLYFQIFTRKNTVEAKTRDEIQGQNLLFAERFVLTKLVGMEGISHCHEIFGVSLDQL